MIGKTTNVQTIKFRIMFTLGITLILFLAGYIVFLFILHKKNSIIENGERKELVSSINAILYTQNDKYEKICFDYAVFSWMIDFIKHPDKQQGDLTISHPGNLGGNLVQIYDLNELLVYNNRTAEIKNPVPIPSAAFKLLYRTHTVSFFLATPYGLLQLNGSTVHSSNNVNKTGAPNGYVFFGKLWDKTYLSHLEKITNCKIDLFLKSTFNLNYNIAQIYLNDYAARNVAYINISKVNPLLRNEKQANIYFNVFFLLFCFALFFVSYNSYRLYVLQPLSEIEASLNGVNPEEINKLSSRSDEFGKIATLITDFFRQQEELKSKIGELNYAQQSLQELNEELYAQKVEIEDQNDKLHLLNKEMIVQNEETVAIAEGLREANQEITDSINYASLIQKAVLAPSTEVSHVFQEHFIFFQPKNIVSGDFYWFKELKNGDRIMAVADCTGHGLSGALLSMLGISFLDQIVSQLEQEDFNAATILDYLKGFFIQSLHQSSAFSYIQDGMHIALAIFKKDNPVFHYASAFHSICLVRQNGEGVPELTELKGNRIPVGIYATNESFRDMEIEYRKGDIIYLYSDGITDQFGGPRNKKYLAARFRKFLLSISQLPVSEQRERLVKEFKNWKGDGEQTDDIVVVGVRLS